MAPDALSITVIRGDREAEYDALYVGDTLVRSEHAITAGHIAQATKGQAASVRVIEDDGGLLARWLTDYGIDPHYPASLTDALALMASGRVDMAVLSDIAAGGRVGDHGPETDAAMARLEGKGLISSGAVRSVTTDGQGILEILRPYIGAAQAR